jgi:hypothetical protein
MVLTSGNIGGFPESGLPARPTPPISRHRRTGFLPLLFRDGDACAFTFNADLSPKLPRCIDKPK